MYSTGCRKKCTVTDFCKVLPLTYDFIWLLLLSVSVCVVQCRNPGVNRRNPYGFYALDNEGTLFFNEDRFVSINEYSADGHRVLKSGEVKNAKAVYTWGAPISPGHYLGVKGSFEVLYNDGSIRSIDEERFYAPMEGARIVGVYSTYGAFAYLFENGDVYARGSPLYGGCFGEPPEGAKGFNCLPESEATGGSNPTNELYELMNYGFCALRQDNTLYCWGRYPDKNEAANKLVGVQTVLSNSIALLLNGDIYNIPTKRKLKASTFDGKVINAYLSSLGSLALTNKGYLHRIDKGSKKAFDKDAFMAVYSSDSGSIAVRQDGEGILHAKQQNLKIWEDRPKGLFSIFTVFSTAGAFAVLHKDGKVTSWGTDVGSGEDGGVGVPKTLENVVFIATTQKAFAALMDNGRVRVWGNKQYGGCSGKENSKPFIVKGEQSYLCMPSDISDVRAIYSLQSAFAAVTSTGTVYSWGMLKYDESVPSHHRPFNPACILSRKNIEDGVCNNKLQNIKIIFGSNMWYSDSSVGDLYPCPPRMYGKGWPECTSCPSADNATSPYLFSIGVRSEIGECVKCPDKSFSSEGTSCDDACNSEGDYTYAKPTFFSSSFAGCHQCRSPGTNYNNGLCVPCDIGYYSNRVGESCTPCERGKFASVKGQSQCASCVDGKTNPVEDKIHTSADECYNICPAGQYALAGDKCRNCSAGYFSPASALSVCSTCPVGSYSAIQGSSNCTDCPAGKSQPLNAATSCISCSVGKFSKTSGSSSCFDCPSGSVSTDVGSTACYRCPEGKYSIGGVRCQSCPDNTYTAGVGSSQCSLCPPGRHGDNMVRIRSDINLACPKCERGKFVNVAGAGACFDCPPGSYCDDEGMVIAKECQPGKFSDEKKQNSCSDCPQGRFQAAMGSAKCDFCPAGKYNNKTGLSINESHACNVCPAGSYASQNGSASCQECGKDTYTDQKAQGECKKCEAGKTTVGTLGSKDGLGAQSCIVLKTPCNKGQYRDITTALCRDCNPGRYSPDGRGSECLRCPRNTFAPERNSTECELCPAGRYGINGDDVVRSSEDNACATCAKGKYVNIAGASECIICPPGSSCGLEGMTVDKPCAAGRYTDQRMQESCIDCPAGRYQNLAGSAKCKLCEAGKFNSHQASTNASACVKCQPGKFTNQEGFAECTECAEGFYQSLEGAVACNQSCKAEFGPTMTSTEDHTECVHDAAFTKVTLVETLFSKGVALYTTGGIAAIFVSLVLFLQVKRMKFEDVSRLPHSMAAMKSFMAGFSFGSELFLILGTFKESLAFAIILLILRAFLVSGGILVILSLYGHPDIARFLEKYLLRGASSLRGKMEPSFSLAHMPFVGALVLMSIIDLTMIQFLPWKKSRFYDESKGYPTLGSLKFCMTIKTAQALVSVVSQSAYLYLHTDLSDPTVSVTAKILFIANIIFSAMGAIMGIILLCMKQELLLAVEEEDTVKAERKEGIEIEVKSMTVNEESQKVECADSLPQSESGDPANLAVHVNPLHVFQQWEVARGDSAYVDTKYSGTNSMSLYESSYKETDQEQSEDEDANVANQIKSMSCEHNRLMQSLQDGDNASSARLVQGSHPPDKANMLTPMMESFIGAHSERSRWSLTSAGKRSPKTMMPLQEQIPEEISASVISDEDIV